MKQIWTDAQNFEKKWWDDCTNTLGEELKQLEYAKRMGLVLNKENGKIIIDGKGKSILDIGAGPVSMLLKVINSVDKVAVDPCCYPNWILNRYDEAGITFVDLKGEDLNKLESDNFDEVWIYNCLQHVEDPEKIIKNAKKLGKTIRIFEWIDIPPHKGHPQELKADLLDEWLNGVGHVEELNTNGCIGKAYFGVFKIK